MANNTAKTYIPLNGVEVKEAILDEIRRALDNHPDLIINLAYARIHYNWLVNLEAYPNDVTTPEIGGEHEKGVAMAGLSSASVSGIKVIELADTTKVGTNVAPATIRTSLATSKVEAAK